MRRIIFVLMMSSLFTACINSAAIPADIIPRQKMETILWQLMQSDEYVNTELARDTTKTKKASTEKMKIYQQVFDLNGTSMNEFKKSYQYYMAHPDITKTMFDSIAVRAGRQRTELYKPKPVLPAKPVKRFDSALIKK
jgi:hypothetical protein